MMIEELDLYSSFFLPKTSTRFYDVFKPKYLERSQENVS